MVHNDSEFSSFDQLNDSIVDCRKCQRLVAFRGEVLGNSAKYKNEVFWRKPVTGFGDINGRQLVVGLAPAASGANRTGRVFTGDKSSEILLSAFYSNGLSNQPKSESREDGLKYSDMYLSLAVRCVPPDNLPKKEEIANCLPYLKNEIRLLSNLRAIIALGTVAFDSVKAIMREEGHKINGLKFSHGSYYQFGGIRVYCCYHPSPRNINTGRTSLEDITKVIGEAKSYSVS